ARVSDYLSWEGGGQDSPDSPDNVQGWIIEIGRDRWNEYYQKIPQKSRPDRKQIFDSITALMVRQTRRMLSENISPDTCHLHLQNFTVDGGSLVEWSPTTDVKTLNNYYSYSHFLEILGRAYEAYVCFAALILPKSDWPNSLMYSYEFASKVTRGLRSNNVSITEVYDIFLPRGAITSIGHKIIYREYQTGEPLFEYLTGKRH
ncbi:hypothetical protein HYS10_00820, partial [Candidatus Collierbacteria bacterium]|nr:hypothetical protein [Candidatus Collierbacteria bacterium]